MIIFFNKKTTEIIGYIEGRVHPKQVLAAKISATGINDKDIGKYIVPFKTLFAKVEEPKYGYKLINKAKKIFEQVVIGKRKVKRGIKMIPDVPFADIINKFEENKENFRKYKVKLKDGKVVGFERRLG